MPKHKDIHLTARNDIGLYRKGDHIEEAGEVNALLAGEHRHHFIRVAADLEPGTPGRPPRLGFVEDAARAAREIEE